MDFGSAPSHRLCTRDPSRHLQGRYFVAAHDADGIAHKLGLACLVPYERQRAEIVTLDPTATADVCTVWAQTKRILNVSLAHCHEPLFTTELSELQAA